MDHYKKITRSVLWSCIGIMIALILYCSWVPNPDMKRISIIPAWLSVWADAPQNKDLRTAVPFLLLGFLLPMVLRKVGLLYALGLAVLVLFLAEAGQLLLIRRHFTLQDIAYGLAGLLIGTFSGLRFNSLIRSRKSGF